MREIKFRMFQKVEKTMVPHEQILSDEWTVEELLVGESDFWSDPMQYTGLKDKSGKEVYEGDVIKMVETYVQDDKPVQENVYHEVLFACGGFMAGGMFLDDYWNLSGYMFEVVGNRFENPELIEKESE